MELVYVDEADRILGQDLSGNVLAEVCFPTNGPDTVRITHTYVDPTLRGQGVAGELMEKACGKLAREGKKAVPVCSYAVAWFQKNPGRQDLLAQQ
ncbi:MAG: N-acetyltransferase [Clostridiales bacterium]|jgi:predicted GNAT family acetyltransferase|nr:N-acetyltransferase [Clostridiales bacterium]MDR2751528.1 N-acetyltransferase [Clostridiales bacterium]